MAEEITIRRARREDGEPLAGLWMELLTGQAALDDRFGPAEDARQRWANDFPVWLQDETYRLFVAEAAGTLVGFISAHRWAPPPIYTPSAEVYIDELYVVPAARRRGAGTALVEAVRAWAATLGAGRLRVGVLAANEAGQAFWRRQGGRPFSCTFTIALAPADTEKPKGRKIGF